MYKRAGHICSEYHVHNHSHRHVHPWKRKTANVSGKECNMHLFHLISESVRQQDSRSGAILEYMYWYAITIQKALTFL